MNLSRGVFLRSERELDAKMNCLAVRRETARVAVFLRRPDVKGFNAGVEVHSIADAVTETPLGITKTTVFNGRPMNVGLQYFDNVKRPEGRLDTSFDSSSPCAIRRRNNKAR